MMLQRLVEFADRMRLGQEATVGKKEVKWQIELDARGTLIKVLPLGVVGKKHEGELLEVPETPRNELQGGRISHFLVDTAERALNWPGEDSKRDKIGRQHDHFWTLLQDCLDWASSRKDPYVPSIEALLKARRELGEIVRRLTGAGAKPKDNIVFSVSGRRATDWRVVFDFWEWRQAQKRGRGLAGLDLSTGKPGAIVVRHGKIRGLPPPANPSGTSLISNDKEAFQSFGLEDGANAPVSESNEAKYREALNHLIRQGHRLQDAVVCFWTRQECDLDPWQIVGEADENEVRELLRAPETGHAAAAAGTDHNSFYALILSGVGGRVMVRSWLESTLNEVRQALQRWFNDLSLIADTGVEYRHKLYALLYSLVREKIEELPPSLPAALLQSALQGTRPPRAVLYLAVRRQSISMQENKNDSGAQLRRIALMKLCLLRTPFDKEVNSRMKESLDPELRDPAYLCGRLLAVMDRLQYLALGNVGAGVIERMYGAASSTPALVFGRLFRGAQAHLSKLSKERPGAAVNVEKDFESLCEQLKTWPATLSVEQQARFALGFYHQKAEYRRRKLEGEKHAEQNA